MKLATKDLRKSFNHERIETASGAVLHFDGKLNPVTNVMKVYRLYGDVTAMPEAYDAIGIDYKCDKVIGH